MKTNFSLSLAGINFTISSMNVTGPKLFQLWLPIDGKDTRFHMQGNGKDQLEFVQKEDCPKFLLDMETRLSEMIFEICPPTIAINS